MTKQSLGGDCTFPHGPAGALEGKASLIPFDRKPVRSRLSCQHELEGLETPGPVALLRSAPGVATSRPLAGPTFHTPAPPTPQGPLSPLGALRHSPLSQVPGSHGG